MYSWGWRIAFGVGALAAVVVMYLRRGMDESASYQREKAGDSAGRGSVRALMRHPKEVALVVGLTLGGTVAFYTYTTYMQKFMEKTAGIPRSFSMRRPAAQASSSATATTVWWSSLPVRSRLPRKSAIGRNPAAATVPVHAA